MYIWGNLRAVLCIILIFLLNNPSESALERCLSRALMAAVPADIVCGLIRHLLARGIRAAADAGGQTDCDQLTRGRARATARVIIYLVVVGTLYAAASAAFGDVRMFFPHIVIAIVYIAPIAWINASFSRFTAVRRKRVKMRVIRIVHTLICVSATVLLTLGGPLTLMRDIGMMRDHDAPAPLEIQYDTNSGIYDIHMNGGEDFVILQLTDIHLSGGSNTITYDRMALKACEELIARVNPNLVIVTGDLVYPIALQTLFGNNRLPALQFCYFMEKMGVPWAFTYGNHDTEKLASADAEQLNDVFRMFARHNGDGMMLFGEPAAVYGRYNQCIRVRNADGTLNRALYLMDTNDYANGFSGDYDGIHAEQTEWYADSVRELSAQAGETVKSFIFIHIPIKEYKTASEFAKAGQENAVLLFGENREEVHCPNDDSGLFSAVKELKSTEAIFAGHDHLNTAAIRYEGVDLVYGMSIDFLAYQGIADMTEQRGGTVITLKPDGSYEIEPAPYAVSE